MTIQLKLKKQQLTSEILPCLHGLGQMHVCQQIAVKCLNNCVLIFSVVIPLICKYSCNQLQLITCNNCSWSVGTPDSW